MERSDLEAIALNLWSAVSDLATIVERLTEADDDDMVPVRTSLEAVRSRIHEIKLDRLNADRTAGHLLAEARRAVASPETAS